MNEQKMDKCCGDFNVEQLIVGLLKTNEISFKDATNLRKIAKILKKYETFDQLLNCETEYYDRFSCTNEKAIVELEIKYLKAKLFNIYNDPHSKYNESMIIDALLILQKITEELQCDMMGSLNLQDIKEKIILIELDFNIQIRFLVEAHEYLRNKIYHLNRSEI